MKITAYEDGKIAVLPTGKPTKKEGEVVVKVKASGICGSDGPRALGGKAYYYPIVVGHEFSGIVEDKDSPLDGKRVCIFNLFPSIRTCVILQFVFCGVIPHITNVFFLQSGCVPRTRWVGCLKPTFNLSVDLLQNIVYIGIVRVIDKIVQPGIIGVF